MTLVSSDCWNKKTVKTLSLKTGLSSAVLWKIIEAQNEVMVECQRDLAKRIFSDKKWDFWVYLKDNNDLTLEEKKELFTKVNIVFYAKFKKYKKSGRYDTI